MRIKIQIKNGKNSENMVLSLPKTISTFYDLHQFLLEKLELKGKPCLKFKLQDQFTISLHEKIGDIVLDEDRDVLSVEVGNNGKRSALDHDIFEEFESGGNNKKVKTCGFCQFIEKCALIKDVFEKGFDGNNREERFSTQIIHLNDARIEKNEEKSNKTNDKETKIEKTQENYKIPEKQPQKIANPPPKKSFVPAKEEVKKAPIIQKKKDISESSSDSDESSDSEGFKHKKPETTSLKNPKNIENASNSLQIKKINAEPLKLNILTPEDEFQRKKNQWRSAQNQVKVSQKPQNPQTNLQKRDIPPKQPELKTQNNDQQQPIQSKPQAKPQERQQQHYLSVSHDFLNKYQETHEMRSFFQINDCIKFKLFELCETTFSPVLSQLIFGRILEINQENSNMMKVSIRNGNIQDLDRKTLVDLSVDVSNMDEERKKNMEEFKGNEKINKENTQKNIKKEYSKEDFISRQVNYYFSDKNYLRDDFIQAHVKKNEEKWFAARLLLNFPKIKQVSQDYNWLMEVLRDFQSKNADSCNFEFGGEDGGLLRKKINP